MKVGRSTIFVDIPTIFVDVPTFFVDVPTVFVDAPTLPNIDYSLDLQWRSHF